MRIAFFSATEFGYRCCQALLEMGEQVVGIYTIPRQFRISYSDSPVTNVTFRSFAGLADAHDVPLAHVTDGMADPRVAETLRSWQPDLGLAIGWYYLVPRGIRKLFTRGVAGIHASMLPEYRGGAPLVWAMIRGEERTGVSFFFLEDGVDTGDLIAQREIPIHRQDTIATLYDRAAEASVDLLREYVPRLRRDEVRPTPQDHGRATEFPQRSPEDGEVDWTRLGAEQAYDWIRAQTKPYPGAFTHIRGERLMLWAARPAGDGGNGCAPGEIDLQAGAGSGGIGVRCADGGLLLLERVGRPGAPQQSARAFAEEEELRSGDRFEPRPG